MERIILSGVTFLFAAEMAAYEIKNKMGVLAVFRSVRSVAQKARPHCLDLTFPFRNVSPPKQA